MLRRFSMIASVTLFATPACSNDGEPATDPPDAATPDASVDASPSQLATVTGQIRRSAQPMGDARGHIYVALFDRDPVTNMETAQVVARALLENADLSAPAATVAYSLLSVPARAEDYFLVAFLDDNGNVDATKPDDAGPDRGDLVSLDGLAAPKLAVSSAGTTSHDIDLNSVLPF
jgi:hypothetical protein